MPDRNLTDKEAAERFRKAQRQNREYQRKHRRAMETAGYKRVTGFLSPTAHEILNRLKTEENANVGQALSIALERLMEREREVAELEKQRREWLSETFGKDDQRLTGKESDPDQALTGNVPDDDQNLIGKTPENERKPTGLLPNADQSLTGKSGDRLPKPSSVTPEYRDKVLARLREMIADGKTLPEMAEAMTAEGWANLRNKPNWTKSTVHNIVTRYELRKEVGKETD